MMFKIVYLIEVLYKMRILSPWGLYRVIAAIFRYGINVMMLIKLTEKTDGHKIAVVDEKETVTYQQLLSQSERLSIILQQKYQLRSGQKVGFLCKNHASLVKSIFAVSLAGADLYLFNTEMGMKQFNQLQDTYEIDLFIYDAELASYLEQSSFTKGKVLSYHDHLPAINNLPHTYIPEHQKLHRTSSSRIILLTGGTTGTAKKVAHKPSLFDYLPPFSTMLTRLQLFQYHTAYIATPIYHGYGIAVLFLLIALGKKVVLTSGFDAAKACDVIRKHKVEVVTVVPLMIHKMLRHRVEDLKSLACMASGGAELNPKLVAEVFSKLGDVLYNLYGTSEAGLNIIATPQDLKYSANTIGRKINRTRLQVLDDRKKKVGVGVVGQFCIKNSWSMRGRKHPWIETGDMGYRDRHGYYFLCGRADDMIVSAGENVYPMEIEQVLIHHPSVDDVAVIGIRDETFGQRLKAVVQPAQHADLTTETLMEWLRPRVARYQLPKEIVFVDRISYTHLGKRDKKQLQ
ncbi:AMP-binding protein [Brevibacillus choshinensis]|uniref:AMP-binding protein n=2 Tax=Brevibacillus choshinensis TaxID=54911 RepID=UPI002E1F2BF8|nr:AMP-binding protein [Brevibacillus choshinensis]MED4753546.1 AMP-binding protein [Brevibacillus choshinensis]